MMNANMRRNENKVSQYNKYPEHKKPIKIEVAETKNGDKFIRKTSKNTTLWGNTKMTINKPTQQLPNGRLMHNTRKVLK